MPSIRKVPSLQIHIFKINPYNFRSPQGQVEEKVNNSIVSQSFCIVPSGDLFSKFLNAGFSWTGSITGCFINLLILDAYSPVEHAQSVSHIRKATQSRKFTIYCGGLETPLYEMLLIPEPYIVRFSKRSGKESFRRLVDIFRPQKLPKLLQSPACMQ